MASRAMVLVTSVAVVVGVLIGLLTGLLLAELNKSAPANAATRASCEKPVGETGAEQRAKALAKPEPQYSRAVRAQAAEKQAQAAMTSAGGAARQAARARLQASSRVRVQAERALASRRNQPPVEVVLGPAQAFDLGSSTDAGPRIVPLEFRSPLPGGVLMDASAGTFVREDDGTVLQPEGLEVWAKTEPAGVSGWIAFCLKREFREGASPGRYTGAVYLHDPRANTLAAPVTFTLAYRHTWLVATLAFGVCLVTSVYIFLLRQPDEAAAIKDKVFYRGFLMWLLDRVGLLTLASGFLAAFVAFNTQFLRSPTWGASHEDWWTLIGAVATAFVAGATAGRLAKNAYGQAGQQGQGQQGQGQQGQGQQGQGQQGQGQQ